MHGAKPGGEIPRLFRGPATAILSMAVAENQPANKHRMNQELSDFAARLRDTIARGFPDQDFDAWAVELFYLQYYNCPAYQKLCRRRNANPASVSVHRQTTPSSARWKEVPFVSTAAFKTLAFFSGSPITAGADAFSSIPAAERIAVFHSSGTTGKASSSHFHNAESLAVYETSLWSWFAPQVAATDEHRPLILAPPPGQAPHSSLVHMFEIVRRRLNAPESAFVGQTDQHGAWTLNFDAIVGALNSPIAGPHPLLLLGTAFSFVHLLDFLAEKNLRFELPENSRVMETGGYKNRSRVLPKAELHKLIVERLGVMRQNIICEYGMSELSSQAYDGARSSSGAATADSKISAEIRETCGAPPLLRPGRAHSDRVFHFPPWARVQIISPETGREVAAGETGLIRVFDLANVFSVAAIQTEDLAIRHGEGFELVGRAADAEPRGCSLNHPEFKN